MDQKIYSILFCALFASTFVHEIRAKAADLPAFVSRLENRAAPPETCELICEGSFNGTAGLSIVVAANVNGSIFAVFNLKAKVGILVDIEANTVAAVNGTDGSAVVINLKTLKAVYILTGVWVFSTTNIQAFVAATKTLDIYLSHSAAVPFPISAPPSVAVNIVVGVISYLIVNIGVELNTNASLAIKILIEFGRKQVDLLTGSLQGFLTLIGLELIGTRLDILQLIEFQVALGIVFSKISGGLLALIKAGIYIKLSILLQAASGLEVLVHLILIIATTVDGVKVLDSLLNGDGIFKLIAQLGGLSSIGITGLFKVISVIIDFINLKIKLELVILAIIQFLALNVGTDLLSILNSTLSVAIAAVEKAGATGALSGFVTTLTALLKGTFVFKGVNISAIITILISAVAKGINLLQALVAVLLKLTVIVAVSISIPVCLFVLFVQLSSAAGIKILKLLGIEIAISVTGGVGLIAYILKSVTNIVQLLLGNIYSALESLEGFGKIIIAFAAAVTAASDGTIVLKTLCSSSSFLSLSVKALFQLFGVFQLGVNSTIVAEVQSLVSYTSVVGVYLTTNITTNVTVY